MTSAPVVHEGDTIVLRFGSQRVPARVLEDRGALGADGMRMWRVAWTPAGSDDLLEFEVPEGDVIGATSERERIRALARIDEFAARRPLVSVRPEGALAQLEDRGSLLDQAVNAAMERGVAKDYELVHRYCVEELGPSALHARRLWPDASGEADVVPTLNRLPAMLDTDPPEWTWMTAEQPLVVWNRHVSGEREALRSMELSDERAGSRLIHIVGYCADMAAWIRGTFGVGD